MIKVASNWGAVGGSTIALSNLVNLFNSKDLEACLYTPGKDSQTNEKWEGITCAWNHLNNLRFKKDDIFIYHYIPLTKRPPVKKVILTCHETNIFPIKQHKDLVYDEVHFVSEFQKNWQDVDGVVIPNVINSYNKKTKIKDGDKTAGIIGSIDSHKAVHESIRRALDDEDVQRVVIYGSINDAPYFHQYVAPLLSSKVSYNGVTCDMAEVYDQVDVVYSSSKRECLPMIQGECLKMGIEYRGLDTNTRDSGDYEFDNEVIFEKWKKLLY